MRNTKEFRERFNAYKNGVSVNKIYNIPKYAGGKALYDDTIPFLHLYEGFRDSVYLDGKGKKTIGYGFTDNDLINKGRMTREEADLRLVQELDRSVMKNNDTGEYEFLKPNWHPTKVMEDAWYFSKDGENFRQLYKRKPGVAYDKYIPRFKDGKRYINRLPKYEEGKPNIFKRQNGSYFYLSPLRGEVNVTPLMQLGDDESMWTYIDDAGNRYTPNQPVSNQGTIYQDDRNIGESYWDKYSKEFMYNLKNNRVIGGKYTMPAIGAAALLGYVAPSTAMPALNEATKLVGKNILGTAARDFVLSVLGGLTVNEGSKMLTGKSWGENVAQSIGLPNFVGDFTNPGYLMSGDIGNAVTLTASNYGSGLRNYVIHAILSAKNRLPNWKGLYRRAYNFLSPKDHSRFNPYGLFFSDYMLPYQIELSKARGIADALYNRNNPKWLINVPLRQISSGGTFEPTTSMSTVSINGQPITGITHGVKYNPNIKFEPVWGANAWDGTSPLVIRNMVSGNKLDVAPSAFMDDGGVRTREFLLQNDQRFTDALAKHVEDILGQYGVPIVGSTRLISQGYFGGAPGDIETVVPRSALSDVEQRLGFKYVRDTRGGTGVTGTSNKVLQGAEPNNIDINLLDDTGTIIHQMESTRNPQKMPPIYTANATMQSLQSPLKPIKKSAELNIPKSDGTGDYTAEEYFNEILNNLDLLTQSVIDNTFKSALLKHVDRAFVMMNSDKPETILKVSTAIDHMVALIPHMKRFSELHPQLKFDDVTKNKEILLKIGFVPINADKFANNPESMKNIVDYWYMRNTVGARSVNFDPTKGASYDQVMSATRSFDNGSNAGGGGNNILGHTFGGFTRTNTLYTYYPPEIPKKSATPFDDVYNAFQRESTIFDDHAAVRDAIESAIKDFDGVSIGDFNRFDSNFTDNVTTLVNKGKLSPEEADALINQVAKNLGVSGYRGSQYNTYGKYFGAMRKPDYEFGYPSFSARRNIDGPDHNQPILPAEWGSDAMFIGGQYQDKTGILWPTDVEFSSTSMEDMARLYPENIIDLLPFVQKARAILAEKGPLTGLRFNKGEFSNDVANEASGVEAANKAFRDREIHLNELVSKHNELKYRLQKINLKLENIGKVLGVSGGAGAIIAGIAYLIKNGSSSRRIDYYIQHKEEIDRAIDKELGEGTADKWFMGDDINSDPETSKILNRKVYAVIDRYKREVRTRQAVKVGGAILKAITPKQKNK